MKRFVLGLVAASAIITYLFADDAKNGSKFGNNVRVPANTGFTTTVSEDGQATTLIFDNLYTQVGPTVVGAQGAFNQTVSEPKVFTVNVPYSTDQETVTMHIDVRGFASVDPGASVKLVACVGGSARVLQVVPAKNKSVKLKGKSKEAFANKASAHYSGDFQDRVAFRLHTHSAKPVCQITLFLLAEHETDKKDTGAALLVIDSLDLEFNDGVKGFGL